MSFDKRVVFDTSRLVSAVLKPHSVPAAALSWAWEVAQVAVSEDTTAELALVLGRAKFDTYQSEISLFEEILKKLKYELEAIKIEREMPSRVRVLEPACVRRGG